MGSSVEIIMGIFCTNNLAVSSPPLSTGWGVELKKFQFWQKEGELAIFEFLGK